MEKLSEINEENGSSQETETAEPNENPAKKTVNQSLQSHKSSVYEKEKCSICDKSYSNTSSLKKHIASVHEKKKSHMCSICDYSSLRKDGLKSHIASVHGNNKLHKCPICDYRISSYSCP